MLHRIAADAGMQQPAGLYGVPNGQRLPASQPHVPAERSLHVLDQGVSSHISIPRTALVSLNARSWCSLVPSPMLPICTCANFCTTGRRLAEQSSLDSAAANAPQLSTASSRTESWSAGKDRISSSPQWPWHPLSVLSICLSRRRPCTCWTDCETGSVCSAPVTWGAGHATDNGGCMHLLLLCRAVVQLTRSSIHCGAVHIL